MSVNAPRVIVVDDEPVIRQFFQVALTDMGANVETFATRADGLARCLTLDFDLAFIDKNLPDGSGLDICAALSGAAAGWEGGSGAPASPDTGRELPGA